MRSTTFDVKGSDTGTRLFESYGNPHPPQKEEPQEYFIGDIYDRYDALKEGRWPEPASDDGPYVRKVKLLAKNGWPQLRYLADFLDCSTVPVKQKALVLEDRHERFNRLHVAVLDITSESNVVCHEFHSSEELVRFLDCQPWADRSGNVRLFVVEDLSRATIELLGGRFNLDPGFFRSHLCDYTWFNLRDPWFEMPKLPSRARMDPYFTLRHLRPHYFRDAESAKQAKCSVGAFNVLRRIDFDNWKSWADRSDSSIGSVRSSTSCYIRPRQNTGQGWLGFLLVDPQVDGYPLWSGYDNIRSPPPSIESSHMAPHLYSSPLEDFVYWAKTLTMDELQFVRFDNDFIVSSIFSSIPAQWLLSFEHINNRLSLIEWEIERADHRSVQGLDAALGRLHPWRRNVVNFGYRIRASIDTVARFAGPGKSHLPQWQDALANFEDLEKRYKVLEAKIDKIMSVLTAVISIEETKKQMANARDVSRITYLAFIYIPFSFAAALLSMNEDFPTGQTTVYWVFFVIAVPITAFSLLLAIFWEYIQKLFERGPRLQRGDNVEGTTGRTIKRE